MVKFLIVFILSSGLVFGSISDLTTLSYSVQAMGRGGAEIAEPNGADSLTSNPAGLAQRGSGYQYSNLDHSNKMSSYKQANVFYRRPIGLGLWKVEIAAESLETFGFSYARQNRNGIDWGLSYRSFNYKKDSIKTSGWGADLGVIAHVNSAFDVGIVGQHILGSKDLDFDPSLISGFVYKNNWASLKVYGDYVIQNNDPFYDDSYARYGLDYMLTQNFTFRLGADPLYYTSGVTLDLGFLSIDYAMKIPKKDSLENTYGFGVKLGRSIQSGDFRRRYALFKPNSIAYIEINGALTSGYSTISLLGGRKIGSNDLLMLIKAANNDPSCKGYLIRMSSLDSDLTHIALVQEIRSELQRARDLGKKIYVYLEGWTSMPSYYLASVGNVIMMPQLGAIHQLGIKYEVLKFDELFKSFGLQYQSIHTGKYKVASSPFSEPMTLAQKENIKESLDNVMMYLKKDIRSKRELKLLASDTIYDGRLISARQALKMNLVDHLGFWDDMLHIVSKDFSKRNNVVLTTLSTYEEEKRDYVLNPFNKIAVVEINGSMVGGRNSSDFLFGGVRTGSDEIAHVFNKLSRDPFLRGVVLRINSPGGSILAADQILDAINKFKAATNKPVYSSMGTYAASGGYYVAMGSDKIFANPSTITGSIGVYTGFLNFYKLEKKWGVSSETLSTGKYVDLFSQHQEFTKDKKSILKQHQYKSYEHFRDLVQLSRQLTDEEVNVVAQGQFMTGVQAKEMGLVDDLGTYADAYKALESSLGLSSSRMVVYGRPERRGSAFNLLAFLLGQ